MAQIAYGKAILDKFITYMTTQLSSLSLVYIGYSPSLAEEPVYPSKPRTDLPRFHVRPMLYEISPGMPSRTSDFVYRAITYYYRRQSAGQNHTALLLQDLETIVNPFIYNWDEASMDVSGQSLMGCIPEEVRVLPTLAHDFHDPELRVSVVEISWRIISQSRA